ncbi:hypothetical protein CHLRE_14g625802v5 [Chlamydomonas reinhardtii]|uniref:E3 ubiquitin protein ligase n=1 Tax=Chlamydomonas reinhardtii TaxID=3055 RepID=A0A2K3CYB9_CHLRE|nr:uncharacterized protein CHLRE_14g625802v5 [Chlamydomonas reinhardtii]PNW73273.1 hypothetical protein CHLRE_14g625802v5 [Chlamydomonas reinhardtii]
MNLEAKSVEQKLQVLTHQNQRLAVQLEEKRKASKALEDKVSALEQKESEYQQTLLCTGRLWSQFTDSITHLCANMAGFAELRPPPAAEKAPSVRDPFVQRLVSDALQVKPLLDSQKRIDAELSDVEQALVERSRTVKDALGTILDAVRSVHARQDELSAQLRSSAAAPAAAAASADASASAEALASENARLGNEASALRRELDGLRATASAAAEELRLSEGRRAEAEERIRQLQNELADTEQELSNVQKKYLTIKNSAAAAAGVGVAGAPGGASGAAAGAAGPGVGGSTAAAGGDAAAGGGAAGGGGGAGGAAGGGAGPSRQGSLPGPLASAPSTNGALPDPDVMDEVAELQALLAKRSSDLEKEKEAHARSRRELAEAAARVGDEAWVPSTRTYALMQQQAAALGEALAVRSRELEALARERDEAMQQAEGRASLAAAEAAARSKLTVLERSFRELQFGKAEADRARAEAERALQAERARGGSVKTVSELQALVGSLQAQVAGLQKRDKLEKASQERLDACAKEVVEAAAAAAKKDRELQRAKDKLRKRESEVEEARKREAALKEAIADLRAFVDVTTVYCNDPRDVVALRAAEQVLKSQVADLKQQLQGHALHGTIRELAAAEKAARAAAEGAAAEADEARLAVAAAQRQAAEVAAQLAHSRSEIELYTQEIEAMASAYEELQAQNGRLVALLADKDEATNAVVAERLKLSQEVPQLTEAAAAARAEAERLQREVAEAAGVREALERDLARLAGELAQAKEQLRAGTLKIEAASLEVKRREDALAALQQQLEGAARQVDLKRQALEEADQKHVKEKSKRQRVEEEVKSLQGKVEKLKKAATPSGAARELQEEVDAMRQLLNCNVCHERQKNRIITKCCHVFCDVCIDRTLTARNRKCPGCGIVFAKGDIKTFFFT